MLKKLRDFCPFLGLVDDPNTHMSFPSDSNCCYHVKPVSAINIEQQQVFCLTGNFENCKIYNRKVLSTLPEEFRVSKNRYRKEKSTNWKLISMIVITTIIILFICWVLFFKGEALKRIPVILGMESPTSISTQVVSTETFIPIPTYKINTPVEDILLYEETLVRGTETAMAQTMLPALTITPLPTKTSSPTPTLTFTPTMTAIYTPTPQSVAHGLDTPIGIGHQFVIHKAKSGENLNQYASLYNTSVEAILRVNYALNVPLWIDALVVIPVNFSDVSQMPYFQPFKVTSNGSLSEILAQELATNLEDFLYYNGLSQGDYLNSGDWVLVPRYQSANQ